MLNQDFTDILFAFIEEQVEFLVVGGYAMAFHGYVRATGDIDLWIRSTPDNAGRVLKALNTFGAPLFDLTKEDLQTPGMVFQMGLPPSRIDIITDIDGVEFDDAWNHRRTIEFEEKSIPLIDKQRLLINKRSTGRPKDLNDVLWLESSQS